jgi:hypothetical protein
LFYIGVQLTFHPDGITYIKGNIINLLNKYNCVFCNYSKLKFCEKDRCEECFALKKRNEKCNAKILETENLFRIFTH